MKGIREPYQAGVTNPPPMPRSHRVVSTGPTVRPSVGHGISKSGRDIAEQREDPDTFWSMSKTDSGCALVLGLLAETRSRRLTWTGGVGPIRNTLRLESLTDPRMGLGGTVVPSSKVSSECRSVTFPLRSLPCIRSCGGSQSRTPHPGNDARGR